MAYLLNDDQDYPRMTSAVRALIVVNVVVAFLQVTVVGANDVIGFLGFRGSEFPSHWWSVLTYMFVHGGLIHLALNMYMLWVFGCRLEHSWTSASFTRFYLWCGLGGLIGHVIVGGGGTLIGASGAVMGVMLGYAMSWPEDEVFLFGIVPLKVKFLVPLFVAINLFSGITQGSSAGIAYFAHLGGIAFGWVYLRGAAAGSFDRLRHRISPLPDETDEPPRAVPRSMPRNREKMSEIDEIVAKSNALAARRQNAAVQQRKGAPRTNKEDALNVVLDKISEGGIESLTVAEKRLLEEMSRRMRTGD